MKILYSTLPHSKMPRISLRRALKALLRRKPESKHPEEFEPILFRLPMELLLEIYSHLPLQSKVCLALSCRDLYQLFKAAFDDDRLAFPRMPANERDVPYVQSEEYQVRMGLLKQLEDSRWACCGGCQRLHRREELEKRMGSPPEIRTCKEGPWMVDICPCITLTARDRARIWEYLTWIEKNDKKTRVGRRRPWQGINYIAKGALQLARNEENRWCFPHKCTAYCDVKFELFLTEESMLITRGQYRFDSYFDAKIRASSMQLCPQVRSRYFEFRWFPWHCPGCRTSAEKRSGPEPGKVTVLVTRNLG